MLKIAKTTHIKSPKHKNQIKWQTPNQKSKLAIFSYFRNVEFFVKLFHTRLHILWQNKKIFHQTPSALSPEPFFLRRVWDWVMFSVRVIFPSFIIYITQLAKLGTFCKKKWKKFFYIHYCKRCFWIVKYYFISLKCNKDNIYCRITHTPHIK